ncbi:MAG: transcriptional repressor [Cytophagales bacterium]|nr:transcriptional repressor [Cytophagales bacterium]
MKEVSENKIGTGKGIKNQETKDQWPEVEKVFTAFVEREGYRKTPERYLILKEIYESGGHFDVDELHMRIRQKGKKISRATLYNTLELLMACRLVLRHQFEEGATQYEPAYGNRQHHHAVCVKCGKIIEFCDPRVGDLDKALEEVFNFRVTHRSLVVYGECDSH